MRRLKLLLDENIGLRVYEELRGHGITVQSIIHERHGVSDIEVVEIAKREDKIIVTMDKDSATYAPYISRPELHLLFFMLFSTI